jgi:hypothetical protein
MALELNAGHQGTYSNADLNHTGVSRGVRVQFGTLCLCP